jgi:hypothetical protein
MLSPERLRKGKHGDYEMNPVDENAGDLGEKRSLVKDSTSVSETKIKPSAGEESFAFTNMAVSNIMNEDALMKADTLLAEQQRSYEVDLSSPRMR